MRYKNFPVLRFKGATIMIKMKSFIVLNLETLIKNFILSISVWDSLFFQEMLAFNQSLLNNQMR
jgi:hypothetical protein